MNQRDRQRPKSVATSDSSPCSTTSLMHSKVASAAREDMHMDLNIG